jgi:hypothetical protein
MALLGFKGRPEGGDDTSSLVRLPSGSFTVDPSGRVVASTLPRSFPAPLVQQITEVVLGAFDGARAAQVPLTELVAVCSAFRITARELRGGAIIFLAPKSLGQK